MARAVTTRSRAREITDAHALLRECLAQCEDEARACLRRADDEPENGRSHTAAAVALIRRCLTVLKALESPPAGFAAHARNRRAHG